MKRERETPSMKLYKTPDHLAVESAGRFYALEEPELDVLLNHRDLAGELEKAISRGHPIPEPADLLAPIGSQEVWGAGVTYERSKHARLAEAGQGGDFYTRVYEAERPELFFKSNAFRASGPTQPIRVRQDARWSVPEPELVLVINHRGTIVGYAIGNDVSSRDIEGENPLYLPQAKLYNGSCALGPCILVSDQTLAGSTEISLRIFRDGVLHFSGTTALDRMRRTFSELVEYLYRELDFPVGAFLMTGTGIVPPDDFTLLPGDEVRISIAPIGELINRVAR
jgi:2-dehydro-3-deoxy-D-arabinonate dehydratase